MYTCREHWLKYLFLLEPSLTLGLEGVMGRNQCRLLVDLIRNAQHDSDKPDLRLLLWQWLAFRVVKLGWHRRLFGLTGYRRMMIKHHGRLDALADENAEESQPRAPSRRYRPKQQ